MIRRSSHPSVCGQQKSLKREEREPEEPSGEALWADTLDRSGTVNQRAGRQQCPPSPVLGSHCGLEQKWLVGSLGRSA